MKDADGTVKHAFMRLGNGLFMIDVPSSDCPFATTTPSASKNPGRSQSMYVYVPDVEAHYQRAKAAGVVVVTELQDKPYGSREYLAKDPEGHLWSFGTWNSEKLLKAHEPAQAE